VLSRGYEGEEALFLPDSHLRPPYGLLMFGLFSLSLAVAGTLTGEAFGRVAMIYRAEKPKQFGN
jgi:hypothetical protein